MPNKRPAGFNYALDLATRLGDLTMLEMSAVGWSGAERRPYALDSGIAIINVSGVLVNDAAWWDETEYGQIQNEFEQAAEDPEVSAILMRVDSPGGQTDNAFETADVIRKVSAKKPVYASVDNRAFSAGYLLASAARKIYVNPTTGGVGSIGVYATHIEYSEFLKQAGIKVTLISAGKGKTDGNPYEPLSDSARAKFKAEIDRLYGEFVGAVSKARGLSEDKIRGFGAALFEGAERAISSGLADESGNPKDVQAALAKSVHRNNSAISMAASAAVNSRKGDGMSEVKKADAAADPTPAGTAAADSIAQRQADAEEIAFLCSVAKRPELATKFITEKKSLADVRAALVGGAVDAQEAKEVNGTVATLPKSDQENKIRLVDVTREMLAARGGNR